MRRESSLLRVLRGFPVVLLLLLAACENNPLVCGDGMTERDPLITLRSAVSAADGRAIEQLTLSEIDVFGHRQGEQDMQFYVKVRGVRNLEADGDRLLCTVACGIVGEEGPWAFAVSAPGYAPTRLAFDADYSTREPLANCRTRYTGGVELDIVLEPEA